MDEITVLMTTYNESKELLSEAIESIRNQTISDFQFLIIIDNPDNAEVIQTVQSYLSIDPRMEMIINEKNLGLPGALNRGIELVNTPYIARMDADDISLPQRLELQLQYMKQHPEIDLIGSNIQYAKASGEITANRLPIPTDHPSIEKCLRFVNVFHHPTFFGKTEVFKAYKYRLLKYSQDYDLICRLIESKRKVGNVPDYLLIHRRGEQKTKRKAVLQRITYYCVQQKYREHQLSACDISKEVDALAGKLNFDTEYLSISLYKEAMSHMKKKKPAKAMICFAQSAGLSAITREQIRSLISYSMLKKKYNI